MKVSLNGVYRANALHYWCNAAGDSNIPNDDRNEDLPLPAQNLYKNYWAEDLGLPVYVIEAPGISGSFAMAASILLDNSYKQDIVEDLGLCFSSPEEEHIFFEKALYVLADEAEYVVGEESAIVFIGENTDSDGDELLVAFPESLCFSFTSKVKELSESIYAKYREIISVLSGKAAPPSDLDRAAVNRLRRKYPLFSRVCLVKMDDPQAPPVGTYGTVRGVDGIGSLVVRWDNGSNLHVCYGADLVRKV